ncbi:MAG: glycine cleavage system protein GcvH [Chloroflexota bacterium]
MANVPDNLMYSKEDEWVKIENDRAIIGISDYAQDALSDIVYLELPNVGDTFKADEVFGVVESVKAASDLFTPISIEILEVNEALVESPEMINDDPYGEGWMIKVTVQDTSQLDSMMSAADYEAYCETRS